MRIKFLLLKVLFVNILALLLTGTILAQQTKVSGIVKDSKTNTGMPGANVVLKGSGMATVTDIDGKYTITVTDVNSTLAISFLGYVTQEVAIAGRTSIDVMLEEDITKMDEIVVVGYGTQKKSDITGAVAVVNAENLQRVGTTSDISKALQGQTSGVQVFGGGEPGAQQKVQIRGVGTFGNTDPLYVVDGVPIAAAMQQNGIDYEDHNAAIGSAMQGGIADFNPSDIESIQVLKDASAAAIYGARGANGVIIITTKRGKTGAPKVEYDGSYGIQNIAERMDLTNRQQFQELDNEAARNDDNFIVGQDDPADDPSAPVNVEGNPLFIGNINTDWQKVMFKQAHITNHSLSYSGGTENNKSYGSLGYFDQTSTFAGHGPDYSKFNAQVNLDQKKGRFKFGQSFSYIRTSQFRLINQRWNSFMTELLMGLPTVPVYDSNNEGGFGFSNSNYNQMAGNPLAFNSLGKTTFERNRFLGNLYAEIEIIKGLSYRLNLSYDHQSWYNKYFMPTFQGDKYSVTEAVLKKWRGESPMMIMENLLNFSKEIGKHKIDAVAGYTAQKDSWEDLGVSVNSATSYKTPAREFISVNVGGGTAGDYRSEHGMISYLGRINYGFDDKYLLTASIRRDYSSRFGSDNKYGDFPSFSLGWKVSNESFFKNSVPFVNRFMIRGGKGTIGNENIGNYLYETYVNTNAAYFFGKENQANPNWDLTLLGITQTKLRDPAIKWEERVTSNIGFDMALLQNKIELTFDYYYNEAKDILYSKNIPYSAGVEGARVEVANIASTTNQGVEVNLTYKKYDGDFHYSIGGNVTTLKNKVNKISDDFDFIISSWGEFTSKTEVGRSMGELYGYVSEGIFQSRTEINSKKPGSTSFDSTKHAFQSPRTAVGDVKFKDLDNNGIINDSDRTYLGVTIPWLTYGFNITADYKGFDLSIFVQGVYGNKVYNRPYYVVSALGARESNFSVESYNNRWRADKPSDTWPRATSSDKNENNRFSTRWIQDGSYMKLKNIQLGYTLPKSLMEKAGLGSVRIYLQGQNLLTSTKMWGYDPDYINDGVFNRGLVNGSIPSPRTYILGVKLVF